MDNNELTHWGIKGMKWGIRRFQNKDGSLTAAGKKRRGIDDSDGNRTESIEAKRERLLKSTNASEIYKNRNLLTTAEINERLNRIDTERRLSEAASKESKPKKTTIDRVNTILKYGNKINEIYNFAQTPVMKALKKKLLGEKAKDYSMPLDKIWKMKDSLPTEELSKAIQRSNAEKAIKKALDEVAEASAKAKQSNSNNKKEKETISDDRENGDTNKASMNDFTRTYNNKTETSSKNTDKHTRVVGEGTSKYDYQQQNENIIDVDDFVDVNMSSAKSTSTYYSGKSRVVALLEDKTRYLK